MPKFAQDILNAMDVDDEFKEIVDKYKEKELTPMEMDLKVRMDRVVYIMSRSLAMLNIIAHLPFLLENDAAELKKYLQPNDVRFILNLLNTYGAKFNTDTLFTDTSSIYSNILEDLNVNRIQSKYTKPVTNSDPDTIADPKVSQMIDILFYNKCIKQVVKAAKNVTVDSTMIKFVQAVDVFKKIAKGKIYITGEEEDEKDKELRRAYKTNVLVTASVDELQENLEKQRKELGEQLNKKLEICDMYNAKMEKIKDNFQAHIQNCLVESEKVMMQRTVDSEAKQTTLAEEAKAISHQYDLLLEDHLHQEKSSRSKRFKIETQLQNWLTKFDQDIGDRQAEYEALKAEYDAEKEAMDELQERFEEQSEEYEVLMAEKAEEEERIFGEMAYQFLVNRSARLIQRAWRAYIERKKARKKAKKGKGKGKGGKGGKGKDKDDKKDDPKSTRTEDPNALLESSKKIKGDVFEDLKDPNAFEKKDVTVEL